MAEPGPEGTPEAREPRLVPAPVRTRLHDRLRRIPGQVRLARGVVTCIWLITALITVAAPLDGQPEERWVQLLLLILLGAAGMLGVGMVNRAFLQGYTEYIQRLERMASEDELTGLANRRTFNRRLSEEFLRARRYGHPFTVILADLDGFKTVNDTLGHAMGDATLAAFARVLNSITRASDVAARLGGDEFALLLPETDEAAAGQVIRRLKHVLGSQPLLVDPNGNVEVRLKVSAGAATLTEAMESESKLLAAADRALYADKRASPAEPPALPTDDTTGHWLRGGR